MPAGRSDSCATFPPRPTRPPPVDLPPGLIAGFDAGQTHTTCRLADGRSGVVRAEGQGPGVSHLAAPEGPQRFQAALRASLAAALQQLTVGADPPNPGPVSIPPPSAGSGGGWEAASPQGPGTLAAAAVGASGIEIDTAIQRQGLELAAEALGLPFQRLWVGGDERTALRGAFPDGPGIVVISGTGTIAVGRDGVPSEAGGREHRCAGWGWMLDGAGSAFDIGRDALSLSLEMADGRRGKGALWPHLWRALELDPADPLAPQAIKARVVSAGFMPAGLAALAPVVEHLAAGGDRQAGAILERNAAALATSVAGVARALGLEAPAVAALGGAIGHLATFQARFGAALRRQLPRAELVQPAGDAACGALAIARDRLDPS